MKPFTSLAAVLFLTAGVAFGQVENCEKDTLIIHDVNDLTQNKCVAEDKKAKNVRVVYRKIKPYRKRVIQRQSTSKKKDSLRKKVYLISKLISKNITISDSLKYK